MVARRTAVVMATLALAALAAGLAVPAAERSLRDATLSRAWRQVEPGPALAAPYAAALGPFFARGGSTELRVGIQVGHWKQEEMPPELGRLRESTGAAAGNVREVDVNLAIARELIGLLASAGMRADLLPATIPPGYLADAFVAIHADGAARPTARGWKIATPWRASEASNLLADAVTAAYAALVGLPEDRYGITYGMKGYYAFSANRVRYAVSPFTPCIIVETGFVTVASDREVIVDHPLRVARAIAAGIVRYLSSRPIPRTAEGRAAYLPPSYPPAVVAAGDAVLRARPGEDEPQVLRLELGTTVMPMQLRGDWTEVVVRGDFRSFGWVLASELRPAG